MTVAEIIASHRMSKRSKRDVVESGGHRIIDMMEGDLSWDTTIKQNTHWNVAQAEESDVERG